MITRKLNIITRTSFANLINSTQKRTSFYNKYKHGPMKMSNPEPDYTEVVKKFFSKDGVDFIKQESKRIYKKCRTGIFPIQKNYGFNNTCIFEHFDSDESIKRWRPVADSDSLNGFSSSSIVRSPDGHALFKGILDNRLPNDGLTMKSGFAGIIGPKAERASLFAIESFWDWSRFNTLEMRFRGDGRKYSLVLNTGTYTDDMRYYDVHAYPFYTRGGPYWQTVKIPFSKFIFTYKGLIQDIQGRLPSFAIKCVAITLNDSYDGPFGLEIDYIGLRHETLPFLEDTAYEMYTFPHIKLRPLQVDCEPPDQE